jgi:hypothetical protein
MSSVNAHYVARSLMIISLLSAAFSNEDWTHRFAGLFALGMLQGVKGATRMGGLWFAYHYFQLGFYDDFSVGAAFNQMSSSNIALGTFCAAYIWGLNNMKKYVPNPTFV